MESGFQIKKQERNHDAASYEGTHMHNKNYNSEQEFQERLKGQIREHRKKQELRQADVANALGVSLDTYQHWEKPSQSLTNISDILNIFQVLDFSTAEIIDVLGLAPLTPSEVKAVCQDEDTLKCIKGNTIYAAVREKCPDMDDFTLEKLLFLLLGERLKRLGQQI